MKFGVVVFPGSNCDVDVIHAVQDVIGHSADYIWHQDKSLRGYDCVVLPGGFSYGDYLREGAIARFSPVMDAVVGFAERGGLVLGICNGFQILLETGLLPGAMMKNNVLQFRCHYTRLKVENANTPFTCGCSEGDVLKIPIAHSAGNYFADEQTLRDLNQGNQVVFRYCNTEGEIIPTANPNGSLENIAGICNRRGNVLGMMPHPERCMEEIMSGTDGVRVFSSLVKWFEGSENCG